jgi:hypothetical protein
MLNETGQQVVGDLLEEFGHLLPDTLIRSTVEAATTLGCDDARAERDARTDVALLADAALRRPDPARP